MKDLDASFLEHCIIRTALEDQSYAVLISSSFEENLFLNKEAGEIFSYLKKHLEEFKTLPSKDIIISSVKNKELIQKFFEKSSQLEFDVAKNYDWLYEKTNEYLKEVSIKSAILKSVDIIKENEDLSLINKIIEDALCKDLKIDLGSNYFEDYKERLLRIAQDKKQCIPSGFPVLDEVINGGFPPKTFSVIVGKVHLGKSNTIINSAIRQTMLGYSPLVITLEMSEDAYAQRFDAIFSLMDINKLYINNKNIGEVAKKIAENKKKEGRGTLMIKEFPTGKATFNDIRIYLRELRMRGINPSIVWLDYLNLMRTPEYKGDMLYLKIKHLSEEARAFAFENNIPIVTVTQFNREGMGMNLVDLEFEQIAEGVVLSATADFIMLLGKAEEDMIYSSAIFYKIAKNRLGGRIGFIDKFYVDQKTLKFYDSTELNKWMDDAKITGDARNLHQKNG